MIDAELRQRLERLHVDGNSNPPLPRMTLGDYLPASDVERLLRFYEREAVNVYIQWLMAEHIEMVDEFVQWYGAQK